MLRTGSIALYPNGTTPSDEIAHLSDWPDTLAEPDETADQLSPREPSGMSVRPDPSTASIPILKLKRDPLLEFQTEHDARPGERAEVERPAIHPTNQPHDQESQPHAFHWPNGAGGPIHAAGPAWIRIKIAALWLASALRSQHLAFKDRFKDRFKDSKVLGAQSLGATVPGGSPSTCPGGYGSFHQGERVASGDGRPVVRVWHRHRGRRRAARYRQIRRKSSSPRIPGRGASRPCAGRSRHSRSVR